MKPLLLLDVDGVLNPAASRWWLDKNNFVRKNTTVANGNTYPVWLHKQHGQMLLDLCSSNGLELVWCTTWEHEANEFIGPRLGLPELPVVTFNYINGLTWKFGGVLDYAQDRPLAWFDDDFSRHLGYKTWFLEQRTQPTLLHEVNAATGLMQDDLDAVAKWANSLVIADAANLESTRWPETLNRLAND